MSETNANEITKADEGRFVRLTKMTPAEADIAAFVNMLNAGASIDAKTATETPAENITEDQLRFEAAKILLDILTTDQGTDVAYLRFEVAKFILNRW